MYCHSSRILNGAMTFEKFCIVVLVLLLEENIKMLFQPLQSKGEMVESKNIQHLFSLRSTNIYPSPWSETVEWPPDMIAELKGCELRQEI